MVSPPRRGFRNCAPTAIARRRLKGSATAQGSGAGGGPFWTGPSMCGWWHLRPSQHGRLPHGGSRPDGRSRRCRHSWRRGRLAVRGARRHGGDRSRPGLLLRSGRCPHGRTAGVLVHGLFVVRRNWRVCVHGFFRHRLCVHGLFGDRVFMHGGGCCGQIRRVGSLDRRPAVSGGISLGGGIAPGPGLCAAAGASSPVSKSLRRDSVLTLRRLELLLAMPGGFLDMFLKSPCNLPRSQR